MELEHKIEVLPINDNLQDNVNKLAADGWELPPGIQPVAVYHLVRLRKDEQPAAGGAFGKLRIDDSLITILPAGTKQ